jgi:tripartite-type tricarboxylate transporter receptor subunit TctC
VARLLLLAILLCSAGAHAQYPARPVRILVGYAAGSSTDIVGRVMADRLGTYWSQSVYVENRGGAAGNLAADAVAKSSGDGYTLLFAQNGLAISAAALPNLPYHAERDLVAIAPVASTPHILIVGPEFPAKNAQELIAAARADPGRLTYASSGVGNSDHLCAELFNLMAGIQGVHVPYKGGAPAATDVMAGRISYYFAGMPVGLPLSKSGKVHALGTTGRARFPGAPDLPTIAEQGLPDYQATLWQGFFAPSSIDGAVAERIARDVRTVLSQAPTREKLESVGAALFEDTPSSFRAFFSAEIEKWRNVVKKTNLKLE